MGLAVGAVAIFPCAAGLCSFQFQATISLFSVASLAVLLVACFPVSKLAVPTTVEHNAATRAGL